MYRLKLLPKEKLIKTNRIDHADWNYNLLLRYIQRRRFKLALKLIGKNKYDSILEIGYGSGIFMPTLANIAINLNGIDIHDHPDEIKEVLSGEGIKANLVSGSVSEMPFNDNSFDLIVSISTFEFIDDKRSACKEIVRVLRKDGIFIMITPGDSKILDFGLKLLTRESAKTDYGEKRTEVKPLLNEYFDILQIKSFPFIFGSFLPVYTAYQLTEKK